MSYLLGGVIPLLPYFFLQNAYDALYISIGVTLTTLMIFGYVKSILVSPKTAFKGALQTLIIGAVAAGASFGIVKALPSGEA
jgi:VIT1/CCC1 family predicted Fe2+/Mn2+ transporter